MPEEESGKDLRGRGNPGNSIGELHQLARSQVERLDQSKSRRGKGVVALLTASAVLILVWLVFGRGEFHFAAQAEMGEPSVQALTGEQGPGLAGEGLAENQPSDEAEPGIIEDGGTPTAQSTQPERASVFLPVISNELAACERLDEMQYEFLSGPVLDPAAGTILNANQVLKAQAKWTIRNTSFCRWETIELYSITNGSTIIPLILSQDIKALSEMGVETSANGKILDIVATFKGDEAKKMSGEWILVVNGQQLFSRPHLALNVNKWVTVKQSEKNSQPAGSSGSASGTTGGSNTPAGEPPERPAPTRPASDEPTRP